MLDAAEAAFAQQGYERASVRSIAARAEVPKGSLDQFFRNKEALLDAVVADIAEEIDRAFDELGDLQPASEQAAQPSLISMVGHVCDRMVDAAARRPGFRTLFSGLAAAGPLAEAGTVLRDRYRTHVEDVMAEAEPPATVGFLQVSIVCTEITRGLLPRIVDEHGEVDRVLAPELTIAVTSYLASVRDRAESAHRSPGDRSDRDDRPDGPDGPDGPDCGDRTWHTSEVTTL